MPNRIIREGILDSERVNSLGWAAEVFYRRLLNVVDDFGRYDGRLRMLKVRLYPLKDNVSDSNITRWLDEVQTSGLVRVYEVKGKPYLEVIDFGQQIRAKKSKFPPPNDSTCVADAKHMISSAHLDESESESGVESESDNIGASHKAERKRFVKPSREEWDEYAKEYGLNDPGAPWDHFESNGWKVGGRAPMKDWRAALRNWKRNEDKFATRGPRSGERGYRQPNLAPARGKELIE